MPFPLVSIQRVRAIALGAAVIGALAGCSSTMRSAPVIERSSPTYPIKPASAPGAASKPLPSVQAVPANGEPHGPTYVVKKGDTLYSIALDHGQDYRDIAAWNQIGDANVIKIGQTLRVAPPEGVQSAPIPVSPSLEVKPLSPTPLPPVAAKTDSSPAPKTDVKTDQVAARPAENGDLAWAWPSPGQVVELFNESRNKGIDIAGKTGDPVLAAGDGKVVYAGNGLRGYGNLVIIKHSNDFLSAYAHNSKLLVKEGEPVKRGQRIAEIGSSDADRAKLHFEVRRQGRPVDPLKYLPER